MESPSYGAARVGPHAGPIGPALPSGWSDLGRNATIAATTRPPVSRAIVQLQPYRDRIFLGYGEWDVGLDVCDLLAWNTTTEAFETVAAGIATDAFWSLRAVGDSLWALATDPAVGTDPDAVVVVRNTVTVLASARVAPWHLFDVRSWAGALYLAGANRAGTESRAAVWRSTDGGTSWTLVLDVADVARVYGLFALGERLYAAGSAGAGWSTDDGIAWNPLAVRLLNGEEACVRPWGLAEHAVYLGGWPAFGAQSLYAFDGRRVRRLAPPWSVRDAFGGDDSLLILTVDGEVKQTDDLATWTAVADGAPSAACSLCLSDEAIYLGTADSHLWRQGLV